MQVPKLPLKVPTTPVVAGSSTDTGTCSPEPQTKERACLAESGVPKKAFLRTLDPHLETEKSPEAGCGSLQGSPSAAQGGHSLTTLPRTPPFVTETLSKGTGGWGELPQLNLQKTNSDHHTQG